MKHRHPDAAPSIVPAERRQHGKRPSSSIRNVPRKIKRVRRTIPPTFGAEIASFMVLRCIRDFSPGQHRKRRCDSHNAKSSDLDQRQNDRLPKGGPVAACILHHKPRHTHGRCRGKQRFIEWRYTPGCCGDRQHQQQRPSRMTPAKPSMMI